jgi:hypothetical protein
VKRPVASVSPCPGWPGPQGSSHCDRCGAVTQARASMSNGVSAPVGAEAREAEARPRVRLKTRTSETESVSFYRRASALLAFPQQQLPRGPRFPRLQRPLVGPTGPLPGRLVHVGPVSPLPLGLLPPGRALCLLSSTRATVGPPPPWRRLRRLLDPRPGHLAGAAPGSAASPDARSMHSADMSAIGMRGVTLC